MLSHNFAEKYQMQNNVDMFSITTNTTGGHNPRPIRLNNSVRYAIESSEYFQPRELRRHEYSWLTPSLKRKRINRNLSLLIGPHRGSGLSFEILPVFGAFTVKNLCIT